MFGLGAIADALILLTLFATLGVVYLVSLALTGTLRLFRLPFYKAFIYGFGLPLFAAISLITWNFLRMPSGPPPDEVEIFIAKPEVETP